MRKNRLLSILFILPFAAACVHEPQPSRSTSHIRMFDDTVIKYNKGLVKSDEQEISDFINRYGWKMEKTQTGIRYMVYRKGTGERVAPGTVAVISYSVTLLSGDKVYSTEASAPREIRIGHMQDEPGLQEAVLLMRTGDRMKAIVPSHMAFGLLGDNNKIPPGAVLVYDIELQKVKQPKPDK